MSVIAADCMSSVRDAKLGSLSSLYIFRPSKRVCLISDPEAAAEENTNVIGLHKSIHEPKAGMDIRSRVCYLCVCV